MHVLTQDQLAACRDWFLPDRPGPLVGLQVLNTGNGVCRADRWPDPRVLLAEVAGNYALVGQPDRLAPPDLVDARLSGFMDAPEAFEPVLRSAYPALTVWPRVILELPRSHEYTEVTGVRPLASTDAAAVGGLSPHMAWVAKTWGGPSGLAASGYAWGGFVDNRLVSLACSFFVGDQFEDIGVATETAYRGRGLAVACAHGLCADIRDRGRRPSWSTSPDNSASLRVAEKLGFTRQRVDRLLVIGTPVPGSPEPPDYATG